jgi:hypothetical protein
MKLLRRILVTVAITFAVIFVAVYWIGPIALSFYAARKALPVARIVPTELKDHSVSPAPGTKLSYLGYEFEIPWDDLDESKTQTYPEDKPTKTRAVLAFRSGLRVMVSAIPPREMADGFTTGDLGFGKMPPQAVELLFGHGAATSDYTFVNNVYEFTPDKMHHWSLSDRLHARETILLTVKSIMPSASAETGIFRVQNQDYKGFQQGNPVKHPHRIVLTLYSEDGGVEFVFSDHDYRNSAKVTQPEINRIVESLHRTAPSVTTTTAR